MKVEYFRDFHIRNFSEVGLLPREAFLCASECDDGEEIVSCVFACSPKSRLVPIYMGVPPLGDLAHVLESVIQLSKLGESQLGLLHTMRLTNSDFFVQEGITAAILLHPATLSYLGGLPDPWIGCDGVSRQFVMPFFLSKEEYAIARSSTQELLEELERSGRDLMSVRIRYV